MKGVGCELSSSAWLGGDRRRGLWAEKLPEGCPKESGECTGVAMLKGVSKVDHTEAVEGLARLMHKVTRRAGVSAGMMRECGGKL